MGYVSIHQACYSLGVASLEGRQDLVVLVSGSDKPACAREIVEARQAGLEAEAVDQVGETLIPDRRDQFEVEPAVGIQVADDVAAAGAAGDFAGHVRKSREVLRGQHGRGVNGSGY